MEMQNKTELTDSYTKIMMSQIQQHFICNTLGTIEQLCMEQPEIASRLVHDFSLYLRGNFREMNSTAPIPLSQEIEHVRHYVAIEQIRFPDMTIRFELHSEAFLLPALTVQPLVENAIRHGLMGLESGGTIIISTYETDPYYCVSVVDDGVGFQMPLIADGRPHIGIHNIEGRLKSMCSGTLTVESSPGKGTKALIRIPREEIQA